jgi:hypothetical protein
MEQLIDDMANATAENPVDATRLIKANNFNRNDARNAEAWTVVQELTGEGHNINISGGEDGNGTIGNNCADAYCTPFSFTQTITGAPAGTYRLTAQGFYRQEDYESENPATPQFFANGVEQAVPVWTSSVNSMTEAAQSFTAGKYTIDPIEFTVGDDGQIVLGISGTASKQWVCFDNFRLTYLGKPNAPEPATYEVTFAAANDNTIESGKATVTVDGADATVTEGKLTDVAAGAIVTLNAAQGYKFRNVEAGTVTISEDGTSAEFEMPANDLSVEYELVRDLTVQTQFIGIPTAPVVVKKDGDKFVFTSMIAPTVALIDLMNNNAPITATYYFEKKNAETGEFEESFVNLIEDAQPGTWRIVATADAYGPYDGTVRSDEFTLVEPYEVTVPAGEYVTYYRTDVALTLDAAETEAKLFTISSVNEADGTATATEYDVIPQNIPMLVYNGSAETRNILLIPTETPESFMFYAGFKGTTEATTIAASSETSSNYAFNGNEFVWVKNDLSVGANKAWLEIPAATNNARALKLVFGETTGVNAIDNGKLTIDNWYDLNGRKLQSIPTKKGVYIMNGKKMVIK